MKKVIITNLNGETVLDHYMGTGSTGVAAISLGRKFIGIEQNEQHFMTACNRIGAATRQPDLFLGCSPSPQQFDMLDGCPPDVAA